MNRMKHFICLMLAVMLIIAVCPAAALAAGSIDDQKESSLALIYQYEDAPVAGAEFEIYRLADVDKNVNFTLTERFAKYPVRVEDNTVEGWNNLAATLSAYVQAYKEEPDKTGITDGNGVLKLTGLKPGLYLVVGKKCVMGKYTYTVQPTIVCVPGLDTETDTWNYEVEAYTKPRREKNPDTPGTYVKRAVHKIWDDEGNKTKRPDKITVQLYADGVPYGKPVYLTPANGWSYTWEKLPECDENGSKIIWTVLEEAVPGYSITLEKKGITFTLKNSYIGVTPPLPPAPPHLPQTGVLWWPVPILLIAGMLFVAAGTAQRRRNAE